MPRELLLPIPHAIADKVHHLLHENAEALIATAIQTKDDDDHRQHIATAHAFQTLAEKLDTLAREAGVIGW